MHVWLCLISIYRNALGDAISNQAAIYRRDTQAETINTYAETMEKQTIAI